MRISRRTAWLALASTLALCAAPSLDACTTLCVRHAGRIVFGKNYDWNVADGMLMVNKRGVEKTSDSPVPARWASKYGSVTFTQYGRDNPMGGMNEAGLVIELMWAEGTAYPFADARPAVGALPWIQYQLDTAGSVADVLSNDSRIRIIRDAVPLHFLVADRLGKVATIEFIGGKLVAHTDSTLPATALANDFYTDSLRHLQQLDATSQPVTLNYTSPNRFAHAARRAREYDAKKHGDPVPYVFETLAQVAQKQYTQWSIVYEIDRGRVHFRTQRNSQIKHLSLEGLDFSCGSPVLVLDLHQNQPGDARAQLTPYSRDANLALIRSSYGQTSFLARTPAAALEREAALPDTTKCRTTLTPAAPAN